MGPYIFGLTGNIGCGKSTVARLLTAKPGVSVYDTDTMWKEIMRRPDVLAWITHILGEEAADGGAPNIRYIAETIFSDPHRRAMLEAYAQPLVWNEVMRRVQEKPPDTIHVVESAMLVEAGWNESTDMCGVIVATCSPEEQERRVLARVPASGKPLTHQEFVARSRTQLPQAVKIGIATFVVETECSMQELERRVHALYNDMRRIAAHF